MAEVRIILSVSRTDGSDVNVVKHPPGANNRLGPHVAMAAEVPHEVWRHLITGDELDALAQAAFDLGRRFERGEYKSIVR